MRIYLPILSVVHIVHIGVFFLAHSMQGWALHIVLAHGAGAIFSFALYLLVRFRPGSGRRKALAVIVFYLALGNAVALIDQQITSAITPYLVATIGLGLGLLVDFRITLPLYLINYAFFLTGLTQLATTRELGMSVALNALTITALGWTLGVIFWRFNVKMAIQKHTISQQTVRTRKANISLRQTIASRQRIFSIIAHDLRAPISTSAMALERLHQEWEAIPNEEKRLVVGRQANALNHSFELLEDMLQWSGRGEGGLPFKPRIIDLMSLYLETEKGFQEMARKGRVTLSVSIDSGLRVYADYSMLQAILRNLLSNAIKHSPERGVVEFIAYCKESQASLKIKDEGLGLSPEMQDAIRRGNVEAISAISGSQNAGIGLRIVRDFLEFHGADLDVDSPASGGATFYFCLPLPPETTEPAY
ncbi:MAG: HAMP domain-containing histidine kinase [Leptospiraceae bacterium]|nr:HAMP domain-containing histidine kinase [Leptospiraceae bacterium]